MKVTDGFFLVGLSNVDADRARNLQLLKERSWFDVPLVYANQRRATIAIEKGAPGERAFNEAFAAWEPTSPSASAPSATNEAAQARGATKEGGYVVWVTSQMKEADAQVSYRARMVGPFGSSDEASQFCDRLKNTGGECDVERN